MSYGLRCKAVKPPAVELHTTMDLLCETPTNRAFTIGYDHTQAFLPEPKMLKGGCCWPIAAMSICASHAEAPPLDGRGSSRPVGSSAYVQALGVRRQAVGRGSEVAQTALDIRDRLWNEILRTLRSKEEGRSRS